MSEEIGSNQIPLGPGKGKGKAALDMLFGEKRGPSSKRAVTQWNEDLDQLLITAVDKYRDYHFTPSTTFEIIKKDGEYYDIFGARAIANLNRRLKYLVRQGRTASLDHNDTIIEGLFGAAAAAEPSGVGNLLEKISELAEALSALLPAMKEEINKNK